MPKSISTCCAPAAAVVEAEQEAVAESDVVGPDASRLLGDLAMHAGLLISWHARAMQIGRNAIASRSPAGAQRSPRRTPLSARYFSLATWRSRSSVLDADPAM